MVQQEKCPDLNSG